MRTDTPSPPANDPAAALASLLRWYETAGVERFVGDTARDRFAETAAEADRRRPAGGAAAARASGEAGAAAAPSPGRRPSSSVEPPLAPPLPSVLPLVSDDVIAAEARERASRAASLTELRAILAEFTGCGLRATAKSLVFGSGPDEAALMLVGEAPGREEDLAGEPFVGRSGRLLDRMLGAIALPRESVRVTNTVPWRPPGNRTPTPAETEICLPFTLRQIELVKPRVLVCLGSPATKAILRSDEGIMRLRGRWSELTLPNGTVVPTMAMLHPAYLLRQPGQKRLAWRDLLLVQARLATEG
ncbi:uracil-DNA glycosylase [Aureimonas pseudogalii]|uniref:Type-4 uracil-DNA glycosylase n=1 Tax=Aureimonas pseudogalii TaxID=1744844 RepID=A0A7W6H2E1_9HYPH|nr:uracil-DNA glycosylase [Aureimonas pseudogalii]MBB3996545.1 DNA polymerase [Aureimonas pseudogalii]